MQVGSGLEGFRARGRGNRDGVAPDVGSVVIDGIVEVIGERQEGHHAWGNVWDRLSRGHRGKMEDVILADDLDFHCAVARVPALVLENGHGFSLHTVLIMKIVVSGLDRSVWGRRVALDLV